MIINQTNSRKPRRPAQDRRGGEDKMNTLKRSLVLSCLVLSCLALPQLSFAAETAAKDAPTDSKQPTVLELAQAAQNPISTMIQLPFVNYSNFNAGPDNQYQNVMEFQPLVSFSISENWQILARGVMPIITQPSYITGDGTKTGVGNTSLTPYFSPKAAFHGWIWGIAPLALLPASSSNFGTQSWGYGVSGVALTVKGNWTVGSLLTQVWASADDDTPKVNEIEIQPFIDYNLADGWYLTTSPVMTYDAHAPSGEKWTVPIGGGVGKAFHVGKLPLNAYVIGYNNVVKPTDDSSNWQLEAAVVFMFPK